MELLDRLAGAHEFGWSGGVATIEDGDTLDSALARADAELYRHKRGSRSR